MDSVRSEDLAISAVSVGEIQRGIELTRETDPHRADEIERWLGDLKLGIRVISLDAECLIRWAKFMHRKSPTLVADAMIAATAVVHGLVVVSRDTTDFSVFPVTVFNPFDYRSP
jgi:hypothetical protein